MKKKRNGFSLIEAGIAMFVLSVGVLAVVNLFTGTARQASENGRYLTATGLAQEGVELVRVLRNDNVVQGKSDVFDGLGNGEWCIHPGMSSLTAWSSCSNGKLYVPVSGGYYRHGTATSSLPFFWRKIYIADIGGPVTGKKVVSVVYFRDPAGVGGFPSAINNVESSCTLSVGCIWAQATLQ